MSNWVQVGANDWLNVSQAIRIVFHEDGGVNLYFTATEYCTVIGDGAAELREQFERGTQQGFSGSATWQPDSVFPERQRP